MPEGRRWTPENPSPAMKSFAQFIRDKGYEVSDEHVAATFVFHREWQQGHAQELAAERESTREERERAKAEKAKQREEKKAEREANKAKREQEKEEKRAKREAEKAEKEAASQGADGDDSSEGGEPAKTRRRLRTKDEPEPVAAGVSEASF